MSFVAELKQRKVFRVATVYLVIAWIAVQVASIALPAFDAPPWMLRVVILLLALGFPFALTLAWALDWTPQGLRLSPRGAFSKRMAIVAAAFALLALVWFFRGQPALRFSDVASTGGATQAAGPRTIAVLPFVNMSGDPANEYFSDGIAETTLDMLAQVPDLKVVARTSSFAFKGQSADVRKIGAALGAANVLEGSVQRAGDAVRITAQLVRATDGFHLWSRHFDRQLADVFKIQDEVATEVVRALEVSMPASDQQRLTQKRTENVDAYQEYLKGIALLPDRKVADMRAAAEHFERAIGLDPTYARAYVAAADTYNLLHEYGTTSDEQKNRIAPYIERALALAPDLGEAHAARATQLQRTPDLAGAEREYARAVELAPSYATGFQWYGEFLCYVMSDFAGAERMLRRAVALDPLSPIVQDQLVYPLMASERIDAARVELAKLQHDHPDFAQGYYTGAVLATSQGDFVGALRALRAHAARDPAALGRFRDGCYLLQRFSALAEARACVDDLVARFPAEDLSEDIALVVVLTDGTDAALAELRRGKNPHEVSEAYLLMCAGRVDESLKVLRHVAPALFSEPPPSALSPTDIPRAFLVGTGLMRTGAVAQGRALIRNALATIEQKPINAAINDASWWDVIGYTLLGDLDAAIAVLQRDIASEPALDLAQLEHDPLLADLRSDPRYEKTVAPLRARTQKQIADAKAAGLL